MLLAESRNISESWCKEQITNLNVCTWNVVFNTMLKELLPFYCCLIVESWHGHLDQFPIWRGNW